MARGRATGFAFKACDKTLPQTEDLREKILLMNSDVDLMLCGSSGGMLNMALGIWVLSPLLARLHLTHRTKSFK